MNIDVVIAQLRALCPLFAGNVAGAAGYANGIQDQAWLPLPAAYVLHLPEDADENTSSSGLYQIIHERIGVVVVLSTLNVGSNPDPSDRRGQAATAYLDTARAAIWRAILNWRPDWNPANPLANRETRGMHYVGGQFPEDGAFDRARFFYQFNFGLDTLVTDEDGWILPSDPLVSVSGSIVLGPGAPPAPFNVSIR